MRAFASSLAMLFAVSCLAADALPEKHSTVRIVFVTGLAQPATHGGLMGGSGPMARIGNVTLPVEAINPIRITIDGDFVGHALVGSWDIEPVYILPEGKRKFTFTLDGLEPVQAELTVLGTGSTQYLIVRLPTGADPMHNFVPADDGVIGPALDESPQNGG